MALNLSRGTIAALFLAAVIIAGVGIFYTMSQLNNPTAAFKEGTVRGLLEEQEVVPGNTQGVASIFIQPSREDGPLQCSDGIDNDEEGTEGFGLIDCDDPNCAEFCQEGGQLT